MFWCPGSSVNFTFLFWLSQLSVSPADLLCASLWHLFFLSSFCPGLKQLWFLCCNMKRLSCHLLPRCCPLPCAALQVISESSSGLKALVCFVPSQVHVCLWSFSSRFPCCFLWQWQLKMCTTLLPCSLPPVVLDESRTRHWSYVWQGGSPAGQHLSCAPPKLLPRSLAVSGCTSAPDLTVSSCFFFCLLFHLPFGLRVEWVVVWWYLCQGRLSAPLSSAVQEELGQICCSARCWWDRRVG